MPSAEPAGNLTTASATKGHPRFVALAVEAWYPSTEYLRYLTSYGSSGNQRFQALPQRHGNWNATHSGSDRNRGAARSIQLADYLRVSNCNSLRSSHINRYIHNVEEVKNTNISYHRSKRSYRVSSSISISVIWNSSRHSRHSYEMHWEEC